MLRFVSRARGAPRAASLAASAAAAAALVLSSAACGDSSTSTAAGASAVSVLFSAAPAAPAGSAGAFVAASSTGGALVLTRAQLVLTRTELAGGASASCAGDDHGRDCAELELGPTLVDLPLSASAVSVLSAAVPAGTYSRIEAKVAAVRDGRGAAAFLAANPALRGVSVRVEGTFDGQPFVFTTSEEAQVEMAFDPPVIVGAGGLSVTVHVDLARWFSDAAGNTIDPRTALPGGPNARLVADNIARSFDAFEDEDHDGHDDRGDDRGGHQGDDRGGDR